MRFFYDTEFIDDGSTIDLISIGITSDDGREYYAVNANIYTRKLHQNPWLTQNVWPHLPQIPGHGHSSCMEGHLDLNHPDVRPKAQIAREVESFIMNGRVDPDRSDTELWADYAAYDHVVLAQLWGPMINLPKGIPMFTNGIQQELRKHPAPDTAPKQAEGEHHAIADARHVRALWEWLATT